MENLDNGPLYKFRHSRSGEIALFSSQTGVGISIVEIMLNAGNKHWVPPSQNNVTENWQKMHNWCKLNTPTYKYSGHQFFFRTDEDAVKFKVIWG
jgi:hypothetical protein